MTTYPLVGVGLPIFGPDAGPESIRLIATAADRLGFHSVSLAERLLLPADDEILQAYGLPPWPFFDALETLTWVAAQTERVRLRTDVLMPLFQPPIVLARRLATLDHLSGGRVDVGVARGWLPDEFVAAGVTAAHKGDAYEEAVAAVRACWGPDPVEFSGRYYTIPPSRIGPKPLQPHIPFYGGAVAPPAARRAARFADGFTIGFRNWADSLAQAAQYREAGGLGPIVFRAGPMLADDEHPVPPVTWTPPSMTDDLARAHSEGIDQVVWDLSVVGTPPAEQVKAMEAVAAAVF